MTTAEKISEIAGVKCEITIRGEKSFTFSFDGKNNEAAQKLVNAFKDHAKSIESEHDEECDFTCVWVEFK